MIEEEIWKDVEGYPLYKISSLGRVRRIAHEKEIYNPTSGTYVANRKEKILKISLNVDGYVGVRLYNNEGYTQQLVHRLVATAFLSNIQNKPTVNHINGVKDDNKVLNLEWSTGKEQSEHANSHDLVAKHLRMRGVVVKDGKGNIINEYQSMKDAERALGVLQVRISERCRGIKKNPYKGYFFYYSL